LAGCEHRSAERIRTATRQAFDSLVGQVIEEGDSFLIIAGDLYDGDWRDYNTGLFFVSQMGRLAKAGVPVFLLYGNHDAESQITKCLSLPANVKVFSAKKPETFQLSDLSVALHGQSFRQRDVTDNLVPGYPEPTPGSFNIGILHTALGGSSVHANYAPCSLDELVNKGYEYWALGHVHQRCIVHERPHVVFPGNLQGRHVREVGEKSAYLISVEDGQVADLTPIQVGTVRWAVISVSAEGCDRILALATRMRDAIEQAVAENPTGLMLACRIEISGRTEIHGGLLASKELLLAEARAAALGVGEEAAWIERVVVATEPLLDRATLRAREDAFGELERILEEANADPGLQRELDADIGELARRLPHDVRSNVEDAVLKAALNGDYSELISEATGRLSARAGMGGE
jgi:DNA repair exonuclease SbcCD nuclease subunit